MNSALPAAAPRGRRLILLLLMVLFFGPLLLSFALYYGWHWRPVGQTNHGTLIQPPLPLSLAGAAEVLQGKWSLVYVGAGDCDQACRYGLYFMRQTYLGQGRLMTRMQQVFLVTARCCDAAFLHQEHPGMITLDSAQPDVAPLLAQFPIDQRDSTLFLVDPRGNLMLRYDVHARPQGLHDDLAKLLNLSHIG